VGVVVIGCVDYVCVYSCLFTMEKQHQSTSIQYLPQTRVMAKWESGASISSMFVSFSRKHLPEMDEIIEEHPPACIIFKNNIPKTIIYVLELAMVMTFPPFHTVFNTFESGLRRCKIDWVRNHMKDMENRYGLKSKITSPYDQTKVRNHLHYWIDTFKIRNVFHNRNYVISLLLSDVKNFSKLNVIDSPIARKVDDFVPFIKLFWVYRRNEGNFRHELSRCDNHSETSPNSDCAIYRAFIITCLVREHDDFLDDLNKMLSE
jgi:hypothetical protein